jgi:hypothetical protein
MRIGTRMPQAVFGAVDAGALSPGFLTSRALASLALMPSRWESVYFTTIPGPTAILGRRPVSPGAIGSLPGSTQIAAPSYDATRPTLTVRFDRIGPPHAGVPVGSTGTVKLTW